MSEKEDSKKSKFTIQQKKTIYVVSIVVFILLMVWLSLVVGVPLIKYAQEPSKFKEWIDSFGILSRIVYVLLTALQVIIAIIPGEPFEIAGGYAFGLVEGTLLCLIGITLGCLVVFIFTKRFGRDFVEVFFSDKEIDKVSFLKDEVKLKTITFIIFCIPGTPKDILSYFIGLTKMDLKTWILITFFARIPSVISSTYAGSSLGEQDYVKTVIIFAVTMTTSLIGLYFYREIQNRKINN